MSMDHLLEVSLPCGYIMQGYLQIGSSRIPQKWNSAPCIRHPPALAARVFIQLQLVFDPISNLNITYSMGKINRRILNYIRYIQTLNYIILVTYITQQSLYFFFLSLQHGAQIYS